jgi:hypothetical protein
MNQIEPLFVLTPAIHFPSFAPGFNILIMGSSDEAKDKQAIK